MLGLCSSKFLLSSKFFCFIGGVLRTQNYSKILYNYSNLFLNTNFSNDTDIILSDFQIDFLKILSEATILNEYLFVRFERFVFVLLTRIVRMTRMIFL